MPRSRISFLVLAGVMAAAACSDSPQVTAPPPAPAFDATPSNPRVIMETRNAANSAAGRLRKTTSTGISYHGGPLLTAATNVAAVYWAAGTIYNGGPAAGTNGSGSQDGSLVGTFLRSLGGSPYFNINTTYYDGSNTHVANIVNYTQYYANPNNAPSGSTSVSDAQIASMLQSAFAAGKLTYDRNTLYAVFTAGAVNLGGGFGTQYCAYHTNATISVNGQSVTVLYAAMPYDYQYPSACSNGTASPNGDAAADAEINTLAHETEETTTDQLGNAWYDTRGYENADKCAWNFGTTFTTTNGGTANVKIGSNNYLIQQNWVNAGTGGCALSY